jgi:hypothetical protein
MSVRRILLWGLPVVLIGIAALTADAWDDRDWSLDLVLAPVVIPLASLWLATLLDSLAGAHEPALQVGKKHKTLRVASTVFVSIAGGSGLGLGVLVAGWITLSIALCGEVAIIADCGSDEGFFMLYAFLFLLVICVAGVVALAGGIALFIRLHRRDQRRTPLE